MVDRSNGREGQREKGREEEGERESGECAQSFHHLLGSFPRLFLNSVSPSLIASSPSPSPLAGLLVGFSTPFPTKTSPPTLSLAFLLAYLPPPRNLSSRPTEIAPNLAGAFHLVLHRGPCSWSADASAALPWLPWLNCSKVAHSKRTRRVKSLFRSIENSGAGAVLHHFTAPCWPKRGREKPRCSSPSPFSRAADDRLDP
jgi:hypothetical protein